MRDRTPARGREVEEHPRATGDRVSIPLALVVFIAILAVANLSCTRSEQDADRLAPEQSSNLDRVLTLGDVDPDNPAYRVLRIQPLADHLARRLAHRGFGKGEVVVGRDIDEMATLLADGRVDIYLDTIFPTLSIRRSTGTKVVLRRAVKGQLDYWSVFITRRNDGPASLDDLAGKVVAFQEEYSTSGYYLPAGILRRRGVELVWMGAPGAEVAAHQTGYVFSRDEENTLAMVLDGSVALGAISSQDYEELAPNLKERLAVIDRTLAVPRTLVSVRREMEEELLEEIRSILLELHGERLAEDEDAWTWSFSELSAQSEDALMTFETLMEPIVEGE